MRKRKKEVLIRVAHYCQDFLSSSSTCVSVSAGGAMLSDCSYELVPLTLLQEEGGKDGGEAGCGCIGPIQLSFSSPAPGLSLTQEVSGSTETRLCKS